MSTEIHLKPSGNFIIHSRGDLTALEILNRCNTIVKGIDEYGIECGKYLGDGVLILHSGDTVDSLRTGSLNSFDIRLSLQSVMKHFAVQIVDEAEELASLSGVALDDMLDKIINQKIS
jgi:hypothetical protein